jgi:serine/threonine-protein kinase
MATPGPPRPPEDEPPGAAGPDRFQRLSALFEEMVELDAASRTGVIERRCGGDASLARELRALLQADGSSDSGSFLAGVVGAEVQALASGDAVGQRLGPWRIVRHLAEGGMGTVYLGERADGAYDAQAAVKLVRGGLPSPALDARFRAERQILAGLSHPGVARLFDGGTTPDGTPYLVMELIEGRSITEWCLERDLPVESRLRLFLKVCDAVAYAHRHLVAHRDLKPSNILVTEEGEPKLLDFGIAKLVDAMEEEGARATHTVRLMTPAYASPEQIAGRGAGVATDVYALGVLLYELLTGRLPIETKGLAAGALLRKVTGEVPPVASSVVTDPERRRRLQGDVDAVLSRALRKEPEERYSSVELLAGDVQRHLSGHPVLVRHDDWAYRTGRMLRRNAGAVSGGLLMLLLMVSFTVNSLVQASRIAAERDRAEAQRASAERVSGFLEELLGEADPNVASGREVTAREVLDRGAARIVSGLDDDPGIRAALATVMGRVYRNLGEYEAAEPLLDSAVSLRSLAAPGDPLALAESTLERGALAFDLGDYEAALARHTETLALLEEALPEEDERIADALDWMAASLAALGRMEEAEEFARRTLAMYSAIHTAPHEAIAVAQVNLADILRDRGAYDEALALGQAALGQRREIFGDVHLEVAHALNHLASTLHRSGRSAEAVPYVEEGLAIRHAIFPEPHPETAASLGNLSNILRGLGRLDDAERVRRESLAMLRAVFPDEHPYIAATTFSLGDLLLEAGNMSEAERVLLESTALHRATLSEGHPNLGHPLTALGRIYLGTDRPRRAEAVLREAYDARRRGLPEGHWHVAASGLELGRALDLLGREAEAEMVLRESHAALLATFGADDARTVEASDALRAHYLRRGLEERAAEVGSGAR